MPFTPSHAVIALPFIRTPLVPAAIAIGAMTPDLPLFLRGVGLNYSFTHGFGNVVWTALVAFALFLIWSVVLRPAVPQLAPDWIARRLPEEWRDGGIRAAARAVGVGRGPWSSVWLAISLLFGVVSHIAGDLFTHEGRGGVLLFPVLDEMWGPLPGYKWLQYGSTVIGLGIIAAWMVVWMLRRAPLSLPERRTSHGVRVAWWLSLPLLLVGAWVFGLVTLGPLTAEFTVQHLAYRVLPPACAIWGALTLILCLVLVGRRRVTSVADRGPTAAER